MSRHAARERALETLFQMDINDVSAEEASAYTHSIHAESVKTLEYDDVYFAKLIQNVLQHQDQLDQIIHRLSEDWALDRMPGIDRNILRLSLYEMLYESDIPAAVVIDEAVELAKRYGADQSRKFINGMLSSALKILPELQNNQ